MGCLYTEAPCNPEILGSLIFPLWGRWKQNLFSKPSLNLNNGSALTVSLWNVSDTGPALTCSQGGQNQSPSGMFWTLVQHLHVHKVDKTSSLLEMFWTLVQHLHVHKVDKTSPLLECSEHWSSTYMFTRSTKPVPFWKCSEHWSSTYMFTRWTKPVPFWNVLNIGPALTCSQGGQNQFPSGMLWTLVQHLHVHKVEKGWTLVPFWSTYMFTKWKKCSEHWASTYRVDKTSPLLECPEHWSSTYMFTGWTKPVPFWKCSEHWSSTYMFTGWTKPVPFWNVLNIGPALTCSQGGQNQSPSGMAMSGGRRQAMW